MDYITVIGHRDAPRAVCQTLYEYCIRFLSLGLAGRSGGADGADSALTQAVFDYFYDDKPNGCEIYLPRSFFNGLSTNTPGWGGALLDATSLDNYKDALKIASEVHPNWKACKPYVRSLHARNVYEVLGKDLATPSKGVLLYAKPTQSGVKGGTNTAFQLAKRHNIPTFNLYNNENALFEEWLSSNYSGD